MSNAYEAEIVDIEPVATTALEAISRAEVDIQISTAKRYPRNLVKFRTTSVGMACASQEIAESCFYRLERKSKDGTNVIEGASIRLAEIAAANYGNIRFAARVIGDDGKFITAQGVCHDVESNIFASVEVRRRVSGKFGRYSDDMVAVTGNAACSIALRNAILRVIPRSYVDEILTAAKKFAVGDASTLSVRVAKSLQYWEAKMGISSERVLAALERTSPAEVTLEDLERMLGWRTAIKDGDATLDSLFPTAATEAAADAQDASKGKAEQLAGKIKARKTKTEDAPAVTEAQVVETPAADAELEAFRTRFAQAVEVVKIKPSAMNIEISAATGGKVQSVEAAMNTATVDQIKQILTHLAAIEGGEA